MNRMHKYTLLCCLFAALFVLGSMAGMNFILQKKENRLLQESGTEEMEAPVAVWKKPQTDETEASAENAESKEQQLTPEQMEEVIKYRVNATDEVLHEPVSGQISMEEAIACGEQWLVQMGFLEEEYGEEADAGREQTGSISGENSRRALSRRASLGIKKEKGLSKVPMEPYYSFWTVIFSDEAFYAALWINAVTGSVWDAEIILYNDMTNKFSWETLDLFAKLAGVQADTENYVVMNETNTAATLAVKGSYLRAQVKYHDIATTVVGGENQNTGDGEDYRMAGDDRKIAEYYGDIQMSRQRIIEYHLVLAVSFAYTS